MLEAVSPPAVTPPQPQVVSAAAVPATDVGADFAAMLRQRAGVTAAAARERLAPLLPAAPEYAESGEEEPTAAPPAAEPEPDTAAEGVTVPAPMPATVAAPIAAPSAAEPAMVMTFGEPTTPSTAERATAVGATAPSPGAVDVAAPTASHAPDVVPAETSVASPRTAQPTAAPPAPAPPAAPPTPEGAAHAAPPAPYVPIMAATGPADPLAVAVTGAGVAAGEPAPVQPASTAAAGEGEGAVAGALSPPTEAGGDPSPQTGEGGAGFSGHGSRGQPSLATPVSPPLFVADAAGAEGVVAGEVLAPVGAAVATVGRRPAAVPASAAEQVRVRLTLAARAGADHIAIELRPERLGRVEVRLEIGRDGNVRALILAAEPATLEMLRQEARGLGQALADAGLKAEEGSLDFGLLDRQGGGNAPFSGDPATTAAAGGDERQGAVAPPLPAPGPTAAAPLAAGHRLDIRA